MKWPQHSGLILANCMRSGQAKIFLCCILLIQKLQREYGISRNSHPPDKGCAICVLHKGTNQGGKGGCNPALFHSLSKVPIPGAFSNGQAYYGSVDIWQSSISNSVIPYSPRLTIVTPEPLWNTHSLRHPRCSRPGNTKCERKRYSCGVCEVWHIYRILY